MLLALALFGLFSFHLLNQSKAQPNLKLTDLGTPVPNLDFGLHVFFLVSDNPSVLDPNSTSANRDNYRRFKREVALLLKLPKVLKIVLKDEEVASLSLWPKNQDLPTWLGSQLAIHEIEETNILRLSATGELRQAKGADVAILLNKVARTALEELRDRVRRPISMELQEIELIRNKQQEQWRNLAEKLRILTQDPKLSRHNWESKLAQEQIVRIQNDLYRVQLEITGIESRIASRDKTTGGNPKETLSLREEKEVLQGQQVFLEKSLSKLKTGVLQNQDNPSLTIT